MSVSAFIAQRMSWKEDRARSVTPTQIIVHVTSEDRRQKSSALIKIDRTTHRAVVEFDRGHLYDRAAEAALMAAWLWARAADIQRDGNPWRVEIGLEGVAKGVIHFGETDLREVEDYFRFEIARDPKRGDRGPLVG